MLSYQKKMFIVSIVFCLLIGCEYSQGMRFNFGFDRNDLMNALIFTPTLSRQQPIETPGLVDNNVNNNNNNAATNPTVFINNRPTIVTMPTFSPMRQIQTPEYRDCVNRCRTTPQYNPICASDMQRYFNEEKFNCARRCGADIEIVRRGSCEGLFPMFRG